MLTIQELNLHGISLELSITYQAITVEKPTVKSKRASPIGIATTAFKCDVSLRLPWHATVNVHGNRWKRYRYRYKLRLSGRPRCVSFGSGSTCACAWRPPDRLPYEPPASDFGNAGDQEECYSSGNQSSGPMKAVRRSVSCGRVAGARLCAACGV